jgi:hypothetical protein
VQNPLRGHQSENVESGISVLCIGANAPPLLPSSTAATGGLMELLQLEPPDYGVLIMGIYIIADDGIGICAGPFDSETAAIGWIDQRHEMLRRRSQSGAPIH